MKEPNLTHCTGEQAAEEKIWFHWGLSGRAQRNTFSLNLFLSQRAGPTLVAWGEKRAVNVLSLHCSSKKDHFPVYISSSHVTCVRNKDSGWHSKTTAKRIWLLKRDISVLQHLLKTKVSFMLQGNALSLQTLLYNYKSSKGHLLLTGDTGTSPPHTAHTVSVLWSDRHRIACETKAD